MPEVPGGGTHPSQAEAVRLAGSHLTAAGYRVEEVLPDIEEAARLWHAIGSNDVFRLLKPSIEEHGDAPARTSLREWLALYPPTDPLAALDALARRDLLLWRWLEFFDDYPLIVLPTHCDLPPPWGEDQTREGQQRLLQALRVGLIAPLLGLAGLRYRSGRTAGFAQGFRSYRAVFARTWRSTPARLSRLRRASLPRWIRRGERVRHPCTDRARFHFDEYERPCNCRCPRPWEKPCARVTRSARLPRLCGHDSMNTRRPIFAAGNSR